MNSRKAMKRGCSRNKEKSRSI